MLSMYMVAVLHVLGQGGVLENTAWMSPQYLTAWLLEIAAYCAVDCFALISGYVGISAKFRWSRLFALWLQVLFYTVSITVIFAVFVPGSVSLHTGLSLLFPITAKRYWYVTAYAGMFVFIPAMNAAVETLERRKLGTILAVVLLFFCGLSCVTFRDPYNLNGGYSMAWLALLYLMGAYARKYGICRCLKRRLALLLFVLSTLLTWLSKVVLEGVTNRMLGTPRAGGMFVNYISPTIVLNAFALLCIFTKTDFKSPAVRRFVGTVSPAALGVYVIHVHQLVWQYVIQGSTAFLAEKSPAVLAACTFLFALIIYSVCSLIDLLRIRLFACFKVKERCGKLEALLGAVVSRCIKI